MGTLRLILGDQLTRDISALDGLDKAHDVVLFAEVREEGTYVRHHKQKIVLILSAMRHFAGELRREGIAVDYIHLDDPGNTGSLTGELARAMKRHRLSHAVMTEPGEWRLREAFLSWQRDMKADLDIREDGRFLASHARFEAWAKGRKSFRMEFFYRELRRETGFLMEGGEPAGGQWNFDADNRKALPKGMAAPERLRFPPDEITRNVMALVEREFPDHFGTLDRFGWPVTRAEAQRALSHFIEETLPSFGDYQDAMRAGAPFLFHSLISTSLNIGLLTPREVCLAAEAAWREGRVPINAAEGFIRQILGWREYVRGIYWLKMPFYAETNFLAAREKLPDFYWTGETKMRCISDVVAQTRDHAYSHHIQRLMVTGNFALLAGIGPKEVEEWYLAVYADAFDWVELPNTHGMAIFADGGLLASKPYAASGAYINRMSDFCGGCAYDPKARAGREPCPFNALYWGFLIRNQTLLSKNPRLAMPYRTLAGWSRQRREEIMDEAGAIMSRLRKGEL
ncbi:MAG: cryptochrome/photolyase family protein [Alphaproteobacteria bacterium]|nr:cryptochrome/photolyase family protein [Alphaproteobacteria bacterium]MDX5415782.1 cryptochrome/photolyase family protein [Alphaproteobacteria bacterium]MDX5493052.1 cryptochrome/photolyase family protein [Alphaproteobacteria bacterium]